MAVLEYTRVVVANCGHEYRTSASQGRRRMFGECNCRADRKPSPEQVSASRSKVARAYWATVTPGERAARAESFKKALEARWSGHVITARSCGHPVEVPANRSVPCWCSECKGTPVTCRAEGCAETVGVRGSRGAQRKWCAEHLRSRRMALPKDNPLIACSDRDCERPVRARGLCNMHYKRVLRTEGRMSTQPWDAGRKMRDQMRRARKKGAWVEPVDIAVVAERDGYVCGICGADVDMDLAYPDPFSRSLDHVVPLALGGAHSYSNAQLSHLRCNVSKGAR